MRSATALHSGGGAVTSLQPKKERPSGAQSCLPQKVQNEVRQMRWLPGTQTSQRRGQSE